MHSVHSCEIPRKVYGNERPIAGEISKAHNEIINKLSRDRYKPAIITQVDPFPNKKVLQTRLNILLVENHHTILQPLQIDLDAQTNIQQVSLITQHFRVYMKIQRIVICRRVILWLIDASNVHTSHEEKYFVILVRL